VYASCLIGERGSLRSLQQGAQVYFEVARIGAQRFLGRSLAEAAGLEIAQELLAEVGGKALEFATDGGFVDVEETRDLQQRLPVEEVGTEEETVFGCESFESAMNGVGEVSEVGGERCGRCGGCGSVQVVKRSFAVGAAVVVDVALREGDAEPAEQRAPAGIGGERGVAAAASLGEAEELGVQGVGEIVTEGG
jgi:hypothetical protein